MATYREAAGQTRGDKDLTRLLPDDALADVLGRLAPRWIAASRCVCKAWHAVIDARRLLRADLLPLSLGGIIIHFHGHFYSEFFSRPTTPIAPSVGSKFQHLLATEAWEPIDHCNWLLLLRDDTQEETMAKYVSSPAKGWAAPLPPCPSPCLATEGDHYSDYLVFDPSVSAHYEVFSVPRRFWRMLNPEALGKSEWPPSTFILRVFSSVSQKWEERSFSREGEPARPAAGTRSFLEQPGAAYWRGSLYVLSETYSVIRISSSESKFRVIEPPVGIGEARCEKLHLGRSAKGVYFASLCEWRLRVWILDESCGHMKWVLRHDNNLRHVLPGRGNNRHAHGPWILEDINYHSGDLDHRLEFNDESPSRQKFRWDSAPLDEKFQWDSDGDDVVDEKDVIKMGHPGEIYILGFHPNKEIVFFSQSLQIGLAYYLNTSRVQVLGNLYPRNYDSFVNLPYEKEILVSFPYTPCLIEMCPRHT